MARVTIDDSILTSTANAIREQLGTSDRISPLLFPSLIESIEGGGSGGGIEIGDFKPVNNMSVLEVATELSDVHGVLIIKTSTGFNNGDVAIVCGMIEAGHGKSGVELFGCGVKSNWSNNAITYAESCPISIDDGILSFDVTFNNTNYFMKNETYKYFIF